MSEQYFKKSTLAVLFTETLKQHPDKKDFLMELWASIKSFPEDKDCGECEKCEAHDQCRILEDTRMLFRKYHVVMEQDNYWSSLVRESGEVIKRGEESRFSKDMVHAVLEELSNISLKSVGEMKT